MLGGGAGCGERVVEGMDGGEGMDGAERGREDECVGMGREGGINGNKE